MKSSAQVLAVVFALVLGSAMPAGARAQTPEATLPSQCNDQAVTPASVVLACADAGLIADGLTWSDWGSAQARPGPRPPRPATPTARAAALSSTRSP